MKTGEQVVAVGAATVGTGAALTAGVASACCVGPALAPVFLTVFGAGGLAAVAGLRPYTPWMLLASGAMLGFSLKQTHRRIPCSVDGSVVPIPLSLRIARLVTWTAVLFWLASTSYAVYGFLHE
jgi:MerT mercuric transport protein